MKNNYLILITITVILTACGGTDAKDAKSNAIMMKQVDDPMGGYNMLESARKMMGDNGKIVEYGHCIQSLQGAMDAEYEGRKEEMKEKGGSSDTLTIDLVDKCPVNASAKCVANSGSKIDYYYTGSARVLDMFKDRCKVSDEPDLAARYGGQWSISEDVILDSADKAPAEMTAQERDDAMAIAVMGAHTGFDPKNKESVLKTLKTEPGAYRILDPSLQKDKEVTLAAVTQRGGSLQYADASLKKDKDIVLAAVKKDGSALEFADEHLKKDKEVVLAALNNSKGKVIQFADDSLKQDKDIILASLENDYDLELFKNIPVEYKKDKAFMKEAIKKNWDVLKQADRALLKDKDFVLFLVSQRGSTLCGLDDQFKKNKEVALAATSGNDPFALECVDKDLLQDKAFMLELTKKSKTRAIPTTKR